MSFPEAFISDVPHIIEHSLKRRKGLEEFCHLMRERAIIEEFYAKELEKLSNHTYQVSCYGILSAATINFKSDWGKQALACSQLVDRILTDIVEPIVQTLSSQGKEAKALQHDYRALSREFDAQQSKHDKFSGMYQRACFDMEEKVIALEAKAVCTPEAIKKQTQNHIDEISTWINLYKDSISLAQQHYSDYRSKISDVLARFQTHEETRISTIANSLNTFSQAIQEKAEKVTETATDYSSIDPKTEIEDYSGRRGSCVTDVEFNFVPYKGTHPIFTSLRDLAPFQDPTTTMTAEQKVEYEMEESWRSPMDTIMNRAWEGRVISLADRAGFLEMVAMRPGRRLWANAMNQRRLVGNFQLTEPGFDRILELMKLVLEAWGKQNDLNLAKSVIILSQTFFKQLSDTKYFLQNVIMKHPIWQEEDFWDRMIDATISEELAQIANSINEWEEERELRSQQTVFSQLITFAHIMVGFCMDTDLVKKLIFRHGAAHGQNEDQLDILDSSIQASVDYRTPMSSFIGEVSEASSHSPPEWIAGIEDNMLHSQSFTLSR